MDLQAVLGSAAEASRRHAEAWLAEQRRALARMKTGGIKVDMKALLEQAKAAIAGGDEREAFAVGAKAAEALGHDPVKVHALAKKILEIEAKQTMLGWEQQSAAMQAVQAAARSGLLRQV